MKKVVQYILVLTLFFTVEACKVSYKFNGASIDYNTTKTITLDPFTNRAAYQWAPMAPMFNNTLSDIFAKQTKLQQVKKDGDLIISGEITGYDQTNKSVSADGYSAMVQLRITVKVNYTNNTNHEQDFEKSFSAQREYDSTQQLSAVQEELVGQIIDEIVDQIFNATVANW